MAAWFWGHQLPLVREGAAADEAVAEASRRTASRRELGRHEHFQAISPEVGHLDEQAFQRLMEEDPDEALALLADLTGATDPKLRELARRLAGQIMVDVGRRGLLSSRLVLGAGDAIGRERL